MSQHIIVRLLLTASFLLLAASILAVPPDELQPPVFVDGPEGSIRATHCDDSIVRQFRAIIPNQPHAQGRVRYRLVGGCGSIDDKTGRWVWYPEPADSVRAYTVTVAAYINNTNIETLPEDYYQVWVWYRDNFGKLIWLQPPLSDYGYVPVYRIDAPGVVILPYRIIEPDSCDHPAVSVFHIDPEPAGSITFIDSSLVVKLLPADNGKKFVVTYELTSGPFSYHGTVVLDTRPPVVPQFVNCPETLYASVGSQIRYQLQAVDPEYPELTAGIYYRLISSNYSRPGSYRDGVFWFRARPEDAGRDFEFELAAVYGDTSTTGDQNCRFWVKVEGNRPPEFKYPICATTLISPSNLTNHFETHIIVIDRDCHRCDTGTTVWVDQVIPSPVNGYNFDSATRIFSVDFAQGEDSLHVRMAASDGIDTAYCDWTIVRQVREPIHVQIEKAHIDTRGCRPPGPLPRDTLDVLVGPTSEPLEAINLALAYNMPGAMRLVDVLPGSVFDQCGWDSFHWEVDGASSGNPMRADSIIRIYGAAQRDPAHLPPPGCRVDSPSATLARLVFEPTLDPRFECTYQPIRFYWTTCTDNALHIVDSTVPGMDLYEMFVSRSVSDFEPGPGGDITDTTAALPTLLGMPHSCLATMPPSTSRMIDFSNGGFDAACPDSVILCLGDINCNRIGPELEDLDLFANVLVRDTSVLEHVGCARAASDINRDGIPFSIEDFALAARVTAGQPFPPTPHADTVNAHFIPDGGYLWVVSDSLLGAILLIYQGFVQSPLLYHRPLADAEYYDEEADETRILCYSDVPDAGISNGLLFLIEYPYPIVLKSVLAIGYDGNPVRAFIDAATGVEGTASPLPSSFFLYQNHPNPFNLETVIPFDLPKSGEVTLEIFNALGQSVHRRTAPYPAGNHQFTWNGRTDNGAVASSGIYYYRVSSNDHTLTRKMVLLK